MVLKNRKTLKLVVCMSLIVALAISALGISVWASFENTHYNSGDQANDIVGVAGTQVGYSEGYDGYTKYGDWYGLPNSDWCAMFVSWCANQAGVDNSVFPSFALCSAGADWFINQGRFHYSGSYIPQAGDLIFYASYGNIYHVGLVTGSDGSNVYSIEGNYNEQVCNVSYSLYYGDIFGYATPNYETAAPQNEEITKNVSFENQNSEQITETANVDSEEAALEVSADTDSEEVTSEVQADTDSEEVTSEVQADTDSEEVTSEVKADTDSEEAASEVQADTDSEEAASEVQADTDSEEVTSEVQADTDSEEAASEVQTDTDSEDEKTEEDTYSDVVIGDVNGDGTVDSFDALLVQRYLVMGTDKSGMMILSKADVNGSGSIDIGDAFMILKMSVHLI